MPLSDNSPAITWAHKIERHKNSFLTILHTNFQEALEQSSSHQIPKEKRDELTESSNRVRRLEKTVSSKDEIIEKKDRELLRKEEEVLGLRTLSDELKATTAAAKASKVESLAKLAEAQGILEETKNTLAATNVTLADVTKQLELKEGMLSQLRESGIPVEEIAVSGGPATPIRAQVLAVRGDANLIMLSVGDQNEVKQGYRFTVYRDSEYLGKVEVEKVFADMCSARILTEFTEKQIKEGDSASTRVY